MGRPGLPGQGDTVSWPRRRPVDHVPGRSAAGRRTGSAGARGSASTASAVLRSRGQLSVAATVLATVTSRRCTPFAAFEVNHAHAQHARHLHARSAWPCSRCPGLRRRVSTPSPRRPTSRTTARTGSGTTTSSGRSTRPTTSRSTTTRRSSSTSSASPATPRAPTSRSAPT